MRYITYKLQHILINLHDKHGVDAEMTTLYVFKNTDSL